MDKYAIYSYSLKEKPRRSESVFAAEEQAIEHLTLDERFELLFGKTPGTVLPVQRIKRGGADKYPCHVVRHDENLVLLRLEKKKDVPIWAEQPVAGSLLPRIEKTTIKSTPYCYVIIDNRPDRHLMCVQTNSAAWRNTNDVKDLLLESLNDLLTNTHNYGVEVSFSTKMLPTNFWQYVDKRRKKEGMAIRSMTFSFANYKKRSDIDIKSSLSSGWNHLSNFIEWMDRLGGDRGEVSIIPPKGGELMKRKLADIQHMVEICANSNYALSVTFTDGITYKCNENIRAEVPMEDEGVREEFEVGWKKLFTPYSLLTWIDDKVMKTINGFQDVEEIKPKPPRKVERQVS